MTEPEFPPLALFGPDATRSAVTRGVIRTAVLVLVGFLAFQAAGRLVGEAVFTAWDRQDRFARVGLQGVLVAHPSLGLGLEQTRSHGWLHTSQTVAFGEQGDRTILTLRQDLLGRLSTPPIPGGALDETALHSPPSSRERVSALVEGLPAAARADVVVAYRTPMTEREQAAAEEDFGGGVGPVFYQDPFVWSTAQYSPQRYPVSWQDSFLYGGRFPDWAAELSRLDDGNLRRLGLPSSSEIKALAKTPKVYGVVLRDQSPEQLRRLLANDVVGSVTPFDVHFDLLLGKGRP